MKHRGRWTPELAAQLETLWRRGGLSCAQIATELGHGFTKNAVIGKLRRIRMPTLAGKERAGADWRFYHYRGPTAVKAQTVPPVADTRSVTARVFGDPLPGRSAWDRREALAQRLQQGAQ
jgi:hypothetical protein